MSGDRSGKARARGRVTDYLPVPRIVTLLIALVCAIGKAPGAIPQDNHDPEFIAIRVGFNNLYKVGHWTPIELTLRGGRQPVTGFVTITLPDGDGVPSTVQSDRPYQILPGRETRVLMYARPGRLDADYLVRLVASASAGSDELASASFSTRYDADGLHPRQALLATQELIVGFGASIGVETALGTRNANQQPAYETTYTTIREASQLPTRWYGYEGVDTLILSTSQPELYDSLSANTAQQSALAEWVRLGGRLVLSVGRQADSLISPGGPLATFIPGRYTGTKAVRLNRAMESYISATDPLPELRRSAAGDGRLQSPILSDVRGRIEIQEGNDAPLVVRAPFGFGEILFVAADLDEPPFTRWSHRSRLVAKLLGFPQGEAANQPPQNLLGYNDLSGQLRAGLDRFSGVKIAPFWLVAVLILAYIALIGPVDFLLVKKVFKRMEFTWFTFPTMVLAVTAGAYFLALWMKGDAILVNQVDVVDVDLTGPDQSASLVRGTSWLNVFSPQMQSYDVNVQPSLSGAAGFQQIVSWMGLPGTGFGGMNQQTADPPLFSRSYWYSPDLSRMTGVPIQVWSTKSVTARWNSDRVPAALVEADLQSGIGDALDGQITSHLTVPLSDCLLAYRNAAYRIGNLAAGQSRAIEQLARRRLADELRERRSRADLQPEPNVPLTTWNTANRDVFVIVEQMMLFEAAGGWNGTQLENRYQRFIDLSNHLAMDQAILVGRAQQTVAPLRLDDRPIDNPNNRRWALYRFLLQVKPAKQ